MGTCPFKDMKTLYIVGAGPGDPELITVKGQKLLQRADVIIYAGSLVNPALLKLAPKNCLIYNSAGMTLEEIISVIQTALVKGLLVVRLHTGDPAIYGAIQEQIDALKKLDIECTVVPGVSSFLAAAASMNREYTLPTVTQTVIITRQAGRTKVPESENLASLAKHQATMCIFLSISMLEEVVKQLIAGGYPPNTPIAVAKKVSWPDEKIIVGTLDNIVALVEPHHITRTALILVGSFLNAEYEVSRLYAADFFHLTRPEKKND